MSPQAQAIRDTLQKYGLEDLGTVARGRIQFKALDPAMEKQRNRFGAGDAFEDVAKFDQTSKFPEPGIIHRAPG